MRKLIRSRTTRAFLSDSGKWTRDLTKAHRFKNNSEAREAKAQFHLTDVELYYSFEEAEITEFDFALHL